MIRSTGAAAALALALAAGAQAQSVHKCIVNGAAVYQAAACPTANEDRSLVIPPPPSQQELLDATANGRLQQYQADTGTIVSPTSRRYAKSARRQATLTPSEQPQQSVPTNNCDRLNDAFHEAQYRRDELSAPGTGATRVEALQRVNEELKRTAEQANASHCQLR